jgi:hypothetical protein
MLVTALGNWGIPVPCVHPIKCKLPQLLSRLVHRDGVRYIVGASDGAATGNNW